MPINIKEILTSDSDLIKVDKTNYNFDQIVANGGGPIGLTGQKGKNGIGNTGAKGDKGDIGPKGDKGDSGLDLNNWGRIDFSTSLNTGSQTVFTVPVDAPNILQYYCTNHPATMGNDLTITSIEETFTVTVVNVGGANVYFLNGQEKPELNLVRGGVYTFDQSDATNDNHPLLIRDVNDNSFTDGVVVTGTPGQTDAKTVFTVPLNAPDDLRYYCTVHGNDMGNTITVEDNESKTFIVTVINDAGTNVYRIDGVNKPVLDLVRGGVYTFNQSDVSNTGHPLRIRNDDGSSFTQGVVVTTISDTVGTTILKPKKNTNDIEPTSIIIGDTDYTDGLSDGIVNPNAWLNIIQPVNSNFYSNFASFLNGNTSKVNLSANTSNDIDTYRITHDAVSVNKVNFEINIKNEVLINGKDALNLTSDGTININAGNNDIVLGPISSSSNAKLDVRFNDVFIRGDLTIDSTGYIKMPVGTTAQRPTAEFGMIRYNSDLDVGFDSNLGSPEAFVPHPDGNYWKPLATLVDADGDTFISPDYNTNDGTENVLTISVGENTGAGNFDTKIVGTIGEQEVDGSDNLNFSFKYNHIISANDDILISNDKGLRVKQNIVAVDSGNNVAQNNGASVNNRTLKDYFYRESNLQYGINTIPDNPFGLGIQINPDNYRSTSDAIIALAFKTDTGSTLPQEKVEIVIDHITSKMSYVKVGHIVTVWGRLDYFPYTIDRDSLSSTEPVNFEGEKLGNINISQPSRRASFAIGRPEDFPYTSALNSNRVVFPISVNLKSHNNTSGNAVNYFGVIEPGTNIFAIMEVDDKTGFISGVETEEAEDHYAKYLNIDDLGLNNGDVTEVITLEYSFSMPTDVNSYDITPNIVLTYVEDDSLPSSDQDVGTL